MWKHFMGVAAFSRLLAKTLDKCDPELAYRCGEMHDVGKIVQFRLNEDLFRKDANEALDRRLDYGAVERANRRPPHDFLGYLVCRKWGFSSNVEDVARWHHENDPEKRAGVSSGKAHDLIDLVILANWIAQVEEFGFAGHKSPVQPPEDLLTRLGTSSSKLKSLRETVIKEFSKETFAPVPTDRSFVRDLARVPPEDPIADPRSLRFNPDISKRIRGIKLRQRKLEKEISSLERLQSHSDVCNEEFGEITDKIATLRDEMKVFIAEELRGLPIENPFAGRLDYAHTRFIEAKKTLS